MTPFSDAVIDWIPEGMLVFFCSFQMLISVQQEGVLNVKSFLVNEGLQRHLWVTICQQLFLGKCVCTRYEHLDSFRNNELNFLTSVGRYSQNQLSVEIPIYRNFALTKKNCNNIGTIGPLVNMCLFLHVDMVQQFPKIRRSIDQRFQYWMRHFCSYWAYAQKTRLKPRTPKTSRWFQPLWKILVKIKSFPQLRVKTKTIWNHYPEKQGVIFRDLDPPRNCQQSPSKIISLASCVFCL